MSPSFFFVVVFLLLSLCYCFFFFFFFNDTATTEIYTLSLHDALPILFEHGRLRAGHSVLVHGAAGVVGSMATQDRKSTRLNSSHQIISYAVFCLKKKKKKNKRAEEGIYDIYRNRLRNMARER